MATNFRFNANGSITLRLEDKLLVVDVVGPGDSELVERYHRDSQSLVETLYGSPWGCLLLLKGPPLMPPEAKELLLRGNHYAAKHGLCATAIVIEQAGFDALAKEYWLGVFKQTRIANDFFHDQSHARRWLTKQCSE